MTRSLATLTSCLLLCSITSVAKASYGSGDAWQTGFESPKAGPITKLTIDGTKWTAPAGQAEISAKLARTGSQCLHLLGGEHSEVEFTLPKADADAPNELLTFAAERWTARAPFTFRIEAGTAAGDWSEVYNGDKGVKVGREYLNQVSVAIPADALRLRMTCSSPAGTGILIDDMRLAVAKPMEVTRVAVKQEMAPVLIGQAQSPLLDLVIDTEGTRAGLRLRAVELEVTDPGGAIVELRFQGRSAPPSEAMRFNVDVALVNGSNSLPITCLLDPEASLAGSVSVRCIGVELDNEARIVPDSSAASIQRRIGFALRQGGQDDVHTYRIPGLTTTNSGTLIAVFDNRYRGGGDLPGDVDVGMCRSKDGGQSWDPMRVIMDMGDDPKWNYDGIGDPSILTDSVSGAIWVAATWSHGNRSWRGSGPGMTPEETGQFMLAKSTDDGETWSAPINITAQIKDPKWRFVLQGPGNGITLRDGTLVFPAQFRGTDEAPVNGKPFSTIIFSKDRGQTWQIGSGVKIDTTEAQVSQLGDGSIMINCRDNRGGSRSVYTTRDLGQTWLEHPTSRSALREPVCNADILRVVHKKHGPLLFFSNPDTTRGRQRFTLKVSADEGMTWPAKWHTLYDERPGSGYSTLTQIDADHIGVLYEGRGDLFFLRFSIDELLEEKEEKHVFVRDGEALDINHSGKYFGRMAEEDGALHYRRGTTECQLLGGRKLDGGAFRIEASLSVESRCRFFLGQPAETAGNYAMRFANEIVFSDGQMYGASKLGFAAREVPRDIELVAESDGIVLRISINGEALVTSTDRAVLSGYVGFEPVHKDSVLRLRDFQLITESSSDVQPQALRPLPTTASHFQKVHAHARKQQDLDILFLGDSITDAFDGDATFIKGEHHGKSVWDQFYSARKVCNAGVGSDRTQQLLWRVQDMPLERLAPRSVVVLIGINNVASGHEARDIVRGIQAITREVTSRSPHSKILVLTLLPTKRRDLEAARLAVNLALRTSTWSPNTEIVNMDEAFADEDGNVRAGLTYDGVHLTADGFLTWAEVIEPKLKTVLGRS